jgi:hypothetical protein
MQFDGSVLVDRTRGEAAARCDSEAANVLGLNMAHEFVTGKTRRRGGQADGGTEHGRLQPRPRRPYAERLLFEAPQGGTEDLDESMITEAILSQAAGKLKDAVTGADGGDEATDRRTAS